MAAIAFISLFERIMGENSLETDATLREAFKEFNLANSKYFSDRDITEQAQAFFRSHDIAHVVFGCDTSIVGEGKVKVWSIFGTTLGFWKHVRGYSEVGAFSLFRQYSWAHVTKSIFTLLTAMPRAILRARRMSKPWPWSAFDTYLDRPLTQIREEFNIRPL